MTSEIELETDSELERISNQEMSTDASIFGTITVSVEDLSSGGLSSEFEIKIEIIKEPE